MKHFQEVPRSFDRGTGFLIAAAPTPLLGTTPVERFCGAGETRTPDLGVMSPASYHLLYRAVWFGRASFDPAGYRYNLVRSSKLIPANVASAGSDLSKRLSLQSSFCPNWVRHSRKAAPVIMNIYTTTQALLPAHHCSEWNRDRGTPYRASKCTWFDPYQGLMGLFW